MDMGRHHEAEQLLQSVDTLSNRLISSALHAATVLMPQLAAFTAGNARIVIVRRVAYSLALRPRPIVAASAYLPVGSTRFTGSPFTYKYLWRLSGAKGLAGAKSRDRSRPGEEDCSTSPADSRAPSLDRTAHLDTSNR